MDYIQSSNKQIDKFGAGAHGFSPGNPVGGVPATFFTPEWCDAVQQENINLIKAGGLAPSGASMAQTVQAVKRMFGGNVTTVNFANSPFVLTADHAGLVIMDATAGNVSATLPAANVLTMPVSLRFFRVDAATNTATVNCAGADTFVGGATSFTLVGQGDHREIESDAVSKWALAGTSAASNAEAQAYTSATKFITPASMAAALQGTNQSLTASGYQKLPGGLILQWGFGTATAAGNPIVFPIAFPTAVFVAIAGTSSSSVFAACIAITATGFNFYAGSTSNHYWFALGK